MNYFSKLFRLSFKQYLLLAGLVLFEVVFTAWLYNTLKRKEAQIHFYNFESQSKEIIASIQNEINVNLEKIVSLNALYNVAYPISRTNFTTFTKHLIYSNASIQGLSWIPKIPDEEKVYFEANTRKLGVSGFHITEKAGDKLVPVGKRPQYFPVYYIVPFTGNEVAVGFDLASDPVRLKAMEKANVTNQMIVTPPITLIQEHSSKKGVLAILPFKKEGELLGYFTGVFRIHDLISRATGDLRGKNFNLAAYDLSVENGDQLLARLNANDDSESNENQELALSEGMYYRQTIKVADRDWAIVLIPTQNYINIMSNTYWLVLLMCIAISVGLCYHLLQYFNSENLLLNILPAKVAHELKTYGKSNARYFESVTVLFSDFTDFTVISSKLTAKELVDEVNHYFKGFDHIMEKFGIEKIKTIGDAYMAAGGVPLPERDSARNTVLAAIEMQAFMINRKAKNEAAGRNYFEMRVGVHTGSVVAGIVGIKKFQYDIWGDTVNIAQRIENYGETGKVNISRATYERIKDDPAFTFESRGKIDVKGKGEIEMWFVSAGS